MNLFPRSFLSSFKVHLIGAVMAMVSSTIISVPSFAQDTIDQGTITYEQTINLHSSLAPDQAALKALIPKERTVQLEAVFSRDIYRLKTLPADTSGGNVQLRFGSADDVTIVSLNASEQLRVGELAGFKFANRSQLMELKNLSLSEGNQTILGFEAKQLTGTLHFNGEDRQVEVWYTASLPASISPFPLKGLPGAVLDLKIGDDFWRYSATNINVAKVEDVKFEVPEDHREISDSQLQDLQEEAIDALRQSGAVISRTQ